MIKCGDLEHLMILDIFWRIGDIMVVDNYFRDHYDLWREKRLSAIIDYYGIDFFRNKKILEIGCGYADIGAVFSQLGASVTVCDGRSEHIDVVRQRHPELKSLIIDLNNEWPEGYFDLVIHMGVLYHLSDLKKSIKQACLCADKIVLETEVCDSDDANDILFIKERNGYDQALDQRGVRPSAEAIEKILSEFDMKYIRINDNRCNAHYHKYDWPVTNTKKWEPGLRRLWFIEKNENIFRR